MTSFALILAYLGCLSSNAMLSMLLLLVTAYVSASLWLISHGVIYTGLLYILVYVGAIVVLIMFVVQLTNTSLSGDYYNDTYLVKLQNSLKGQNSIVILALRNTFNIGRLLLIFSLIVLLAGAYSNLDYNLILNFSNFNLTDISISPNNYENSFSHLSSQFKLNNNLFWLASSIFNEYGYLLVVSIHAIILAVIGPIKLALEN